MWVERFNAALADGYRRERVAIRANELGKERTMPRFQNDEATSHPLVTEMGVGTYHWCKCGMTKTVPYCDGSHAGTGVEPLAFVIEPAGTYAVCNCGLTANPPFCDGSHAGIE
jgi:CDGSH-type Zn-finger protein